VHGAIDIAEAIMDGDHRRRIRGLSQQLDQIAFEHELEIPDDIKAIEEQLAEMRAERSGDIVRIGAGDSYLKMFEASSAKSGVVGVPIALPEIAKVLSEPVFEAGNLYGFLSSSGEGKTSLTMQIIYHAIKAGHPTQFLSYDQSAGQCVRQMIAQNLGIEVRRQREPAKFLKDAEQNQCLDFAMWINKQPLEIIRCQREGVAQLTAYGRRFVKRNANGKTPLIIIDHIGKVKPRDPKLSPDRISGDVTVELKSFADETGSAVMILNQRNSEGTKRDNPRPISRDLYGGEGAKADYDAILFLYRPEKYRADRVAIATDQDWKKIRSVYGEDEEQWKDVAEVGVIKSRFGDPSLREQLKFEAQYTRYTSKRNIEPELFQ
jgi:replicative DNA helicase